MKKLLIIFIGFLSACDSSIDQNISSETQVILDTIIITETLFDTVFVEKQLEDGYKNTEYYVQESLPEWFLESQKLKSAEFINVYQLDKRLNPYYFEADYNGDGFIDIAIPIFEIETNKIGFAIIHGSTYELFIIGAGTLINNGLSDDMSYIDMWRINRDEINGPGLGEETGSGEKGELFLENPSLQIEKTELGGGQIYWNGTEYAYFHQTC